MKKYYIYAFLDGSKPGIYKYEDIIFNYEPFYIGKGTDNRIKSSLLDRECPFKVNKIKKIINSGAEIISIKIFENLENLEAFEKEKEVISKIGRRNMKMGPLVNLTDGGDGRLNSPHSEETKRKISETKKMQNLSIPHTTETKDKLREINKGENNPMYGKHHSDDIKENQSIRVSGINHPMYGKKHSQESILKIKQNRKFNQQNINEISRKNNSKSILQFDKEGNFIKEYDSIKIASKEIGLSESLIGKCCRGKIKNPSKFIFKFKYESSLVFNNSFKIKIGDVILINDKTLKLIKRYKQSFIVEDDTGNQISFRKKEFEFVWEKNSFNLS